METLFSTKERVKILGKVIFQNGSISVNCIASQLRLSKGLVSKYLDMLAKHGILRRTGGKFMAAQSALGRGIKILLNIDKCPVAVLKKYPFVKAAGIYGSCAKGENNEDSDVDLWIRVDDVPDESLAKLSAALKKKAENLKILFFTDNKIEGLKKKDELFYHSLAFGSIIIYGDENGIQLQ